jgi:hypothetical protein
MFKNKLSEKFNQELQTPEIIEIIKKGKDVNIKFKNSHPNEKRTFMIFYIDTESPNSGIWVEKKIICEKEICEIKLGDMYGKRYHLVIVETDGQIIGNLGKIIKFGDNDPYLPYHIFPTETKVQSLENDKNDINGINGINGISENDKNDISENDKNDENDINGISESPINSPYVICGSNPIVKYLEDETDINNIEIREKCKKDKEIHRIKKKVKRSLWNEFKKGYLSVDLNLAN